LDDPRPDCLDQLGGVQVSAAGIRHLDSDATVTLSAMKAICHSTYGSPDVLEFQDVDPPAVTDDDVLVRVRAASVNPLDFHYMRGTPYLVRLQNGLSRPRPHGLGADLAGVVDAVGRNVTGFQPGDEVFACYDLARRAHSGAFAEYACVRQDKAVLAKPANLTFEQAAAVPVAAVTALQALRDRGRLRRGQRVLVNGAAGGVGTFAVQLAKALGAAEVTAVCSTRNIGQTRSLGADRVVDYTHEDFTRLGERHDLMLDVAGGRRFADVRRVLAPKATVVVVGAPDKGRWIGPARGTLAMTMYSPFVSQRVAMMLATPKRDDLAFLADLLADGAVTPVIDRTYPLSGVPEAIRYLETGHARGKVVITV
jgi:NADPH:quinone reductase-like Zn-dependent oxidoreductase